MIFTDLEKECEKHILKGRFERKRKIAGSTKICCVVVSLRERRLRKEKKSAKTRLLTGKTINKIRVADLRFVYLNTLYRLFILAAKVAKKNGRKKEKRILI